MFFLFKKPGNSKEIASPSFYFEWYFWLLMEVFIVLHWFQPESSRIPEFLEFHGIKFGWGTSQIKIPFRWNSEVISIPAEWFPEFPERNGLGMAPEWNPRNYCRFFFLSFFFLCHMSQYSQHCSTLLLVLQLQSQQPWPGNSRNSLSNSGNSGNSLSNSGNSGNSLGISGGMKSTGAEGPVLLLEREETTPTSREDSLVVLRGPASLGRGESTPMSLEDSLVLLRCWCHRWEGKKKHQQVVKTHWWYWGQCHWWEVKWCWGAGIVAGKGRKHTNESWRLVGGTEGAGVAGKERRKHTNESWRLVGGAGASVITGMGRKHTNESWRLVGGAEGAGVVTGKGRKHTNESWRLIGGAGAGVVPGKGEKKKHTNESSRLIGGAKGPASSLPATVLR